MAFASFDRQRSAAPVAEINMVPLIDVMLVLLVIFIITAPLIGSRLELDLPRAEGVGAGDAPAFVALAIDQDGRLYVGEQAVAPEQLIERVRDAARRDPATEVQLRADRRVPYGRVAELIGWVQQAGLTRIGFVTEAPR